MSEDSDLMDRQSALMNSRVGYSQQDPNAMNTLLLEKLDVDRLLDKVELDLQGLEYDSKGNLVQVCEPLMNKEGARSVKRMMMAQVNNVNQMSNYEEDQVRVMIEELALDLVEDVIFNKVRYGVKNTDTNLTAIRQIAISPGFAVAMGAMENGLRQMLKKTTVETSVNVQGQTKQSGGKGGGIFGLFKGGK